MSKVQNNLNQLFIRYRLIFWYDPNSDFKNDFDSFNESGIEKIVLNKNEFGVKYQILNDPDPQARFLIYIPSERPSDQANWLLDLILQGHEFKADKASLVRQEIGLSLDFLPLIQQHIKFFNSAQRKQEFTELVTTDDDDASLRLKMLSVLANSTAELDSIVLEFINQSVQGELLDLDPTNVKLPPHDLFDFFWKEVCRHFGYCEDGPTVREFIVFLFKGANPLDADVAQNDHSLLFMQRWKDSNSHRSSFEQWASRMEREFNLPERLDAGECDLELKEEDTFEIFDK